MAINLNQLALDTATVEVEFQGHTADVTYRPAAITTNRLSELQRSAVDDDTDAITEFLVDVLEDWDVKRGSKKVPIDVENMGIIPMVFLRSIMFAIMEDSSAGEA